MSEESNTKAILELVTVVESMRKRLSLMQAESVATRTALISALSVGLDRAKVAHDLRSIASRYEDLAISYPLSDEDISESVQAILALAAKLD